MIRSTSQQLGHVLGHGPWLAADLRGADGGRLEDELNDLRRGGGLPAAVARRLGDRPVISRSTPTSRSSTPASPSGSAAAQTGRVLPALPVDERKLAGWPEFNDQIDVR